MHTMLAERPLRVRMSDLELWPGEKFISEDEIWLRIAKHLDPGVRRDIVGWMNGFDEAPKSRSNRGIRDLLRDYIRGAAAVIDPFPSTPPIAMKTDRELVLDDAQSVMGDLRDVAMLIGVIARQKGGHSGKGRGRAKGIG